MKKLLILFAIIFLLTGCNDYVEIDDIIIISGMLIDYKNNMYEVTSQVIENETKTKIKVYTTTCNNIDECIYKISKISNKDIFISHLKVLILTESTIKNDKNFYDYFLRETKSKMNFYVYYVDEQYKDEILNIYKEDKGSSLYIKDLMDFNSKIFSSSTPISFLDYMQMKLEYGINPIYPNLKIKDSNDNKIIYLENIIVFNDNYNKITLNDNEGIFYNILKNKTNKTILNIPCKDKDFSIIVDDVNTKYNWDNNTFNIKINLKSNINSYNCELDLNNPQNIDKLSNIANKYIKDNIHNIINIAKENNVDFIGIGSYIYKHDKNYFDFKNNNWNNNLKNIETNIEVKTIINSIGEIKNGI
jgi:Ger(x)C family germination protein